MSVAPARPHPFSFADADFFAFSRAQARAQCAPETIPVTRSGCHGGPSATGSCGRAPQPYAEMAAATPGARSQVPAMPTDSVNGWHSSFVGDIVQGLARRSRRDAAPAPAPPPSQVGQIELNAQVLQ
jgi:hypothetical protein